MLAAPRSSRQPSRSGSFRRSSTRYGVGHSFGTHVDGAIRAIPGTPIRIRTDLSVTLFLAEPEEYDGGELTVEDKYGAHEVKLPAGDLVLYPATSLHHVKPVTVAHGLLLFLAAKHGA